MPAAMNRGRGSRDVVFVSPGPSRIHRRALPQCSEPPVSVGTVAPTCGRGSGIMAIRFSDLRDRHGTLTETTIGSDDRGVGRVAGIRWSWGWNGGGGVLCNVEMRRLRPEQAGLDSASGLLPKCCGLTTERRGLLAPTLVRQHASARLLPRWRVSVKRVCAWSGGQTVLCWLVRTTEPPPCVPSSSSHSSSPSSSFSPSFAAAAAAAACSSESILVAPSPVSSSSRPCLFPPAASSSCKPLCSSATRTLT
eukprot:938140-Rhodomonas_salina.1